MESRLIKLKLPPTISVAALTDIPHSKSMLKGLEVPEKNNIVEGYRLEENCNIELPFRFFAEINVDNDRLWSLFKRMLISMPEEVSLISGYKDEEGEELYYGHYLDKYSLYNKLEKYEKELTMDGLLQFGVIHYKDDYLEEVFVHNAKYIQYWGMDIGKFKKIMNDFSIYHVNNLEYIDSYPMVTYTLNAIDKEAMDTNELLDILKTEI